MRKHRNDSVFRVTGDGPIGLKSFFGTPVHKCGYCGKTKDIVFHIVENDKHVYLCEACGLKRENQNK